MYVNATNHLTEHMATFIAICINGLHPCRDARLHDSRCSWYCSMPIMKPNKSCIHSTTANGRNDCLILVICDRNDWLSATLMLTPMMLVQFLLFRSDHKQQLSEHWWTSFVDQPFVPGYLACPRECTRLALSVTGTFEAAIAPCFSAMTNYVLFMAIYDMVSSPLRSVTTWQIQLEYPRL